MAEDVVVEGRDAGGGEAEQEAVEHRVVEAPPRGRERLAAIIAAMPAAAEIRSVNTSCAACAIARPSEAEPPPVARQKLRAPIASATSAKRKVTAAMPVIAPQGITS